MKIGHPKRKLVFQPSIFRCELLVSRRVISFLSFHLRSHLVPPFSSAHQRSAARLRGMRSPHWVMKSYGQAQWKWQWTSSKCPYTWGWKQKLSWLKKRFEGLMAKTEPIVVESFFWSCFLSLLFFHHFWRFYQSHASRIGSCAFGDFSDGIRSAFQMLNVFSTAKLWTLHSKWETCRNYERDLRWQTASRRKEHLDLNHFKRKLDNAK